VPPSTELSYLQAVVIGLLQGVTELFPVSSLGHSVLVPAWIGGSWEHLVTEGTQKDSTYPAFIVALHVATAVALLVFYARDWVGIIGGLVTVLRTRPVQTSTQRLAMLMRRVPGATRLLQGNRAARCADLQRRRVRARRTLVGRPTGPQQRLSHGCVNLSPANAQWFYDHFGLGDVVTVTHSGGPPLPVWDTYGDWALRWAQWQAGAH